MFYDFLLFWGFLGRLCDVYFGKSTCQIIGEIGSKWVMGHVGYMAISRHPLIWCLWLKFMIVPYTITILRIENQACRAILRKMVRTFTNTRYNVISLISVSHLTSSKLLWNCSNVWYMRDRHGPASPVEGITSLYKYSLLMHRIKIKSPANFLWNEQNVFVGGFITFQSVLFWRYYNDKKPTRYWRYYHSRCRPPAAMGGAIGAWHPHHERWAYTSNFV